VARFVFVSLVLIVILLATDFYVFRHWRTFVRSQGRMRSRSRGSRAPRARILRWTVPPYGVLMPVMAVSLPLYLATSNWWEVEPKLWRGLFVGTWVLYYVPKFVIATVLATKDASRGVYWLFRWFRTRLAADRQESDQTSAEETVRPLDLSDMNRIPRREFLRKLGWSAATVPYVVVGYSVFRSLYDYQVFRIDVPISGLPAALDGVTIAQLSDLHAGSFFSERPLLDAVSTIEGLKPDLVAITGDFVNHAAAELSMVMPALHRLRAPLGVYGCLGNHDHYAHLPDVVRGIGQTSVDLMINSHRTIRVDKASLHLVGTDNTGFRQHYADLPRALAGLQPNPNGEEARILLAHDPTFWDGYVRPDYPDIDLMLCGHTHGGQIGYELGPFRWSLARIRYARWAGLYHEQRSSGAGRQYLYVNRGAGTVGPPLRLGIRPEITFLTLRRASMLK
jgi:uncharacterized protein